MGSLMLIMGVEAFNVNNKEFTILPKSDKGKLLLLLLLRKILYFLDKKVLFLYTENLIIFKHENSSISKHKNSSFWFVFLGFLNFNFICLGVK